jgi:hypothetical protein
MKQKYKMPVLLLVSLIAVNVELMNGVLLNFVYLAQQELLALVEISHQHMIHLLNAQMDKF